MKAKKSLGQNFLMHTKTGERIVAAANLPENATVLEIGPGTGMLTAELLKVAGKVVAVEADESLIPGLRERFATEVEAGRLQIVAGDIRNFDSSGLGEYHLVANIPYYITGEIIRKFLTAKNQPRSLTLLVQKEVAERIARSKKESLLSLSVKVYGVPKYQFTVPRGAFVPAPSVDSAVLSITGVSRAAFDSEQEETTFFEVIRAGFAHKRKRLAKNLEEYWPHEAVENAFYEATLSPDTRAEDLPLTAWLTLARALKASPTD